MPDEPAVVFRTLKGNDVEVCAEKLIYVGDVAFAESPDGSRLRLDASNLELLDDESAGRPAWYLHRGFVVLP